MNPYDLQKHNRRSMRLKDYDYSQPGAYFITLVTHNRDMLFGKVVDGEVQLSFLGQIVYDEWLKSNLLRREICLYEDEFIVMPNHIHGIVWIGVGADGVRPGYYGDHTLLREPRHQHSKLTRLPRSLSAFVAGYKAVVTSHAVHELNMSVIWQRNYHDHIIRDEREFLKIWHYIDTNPQ